MTEEKSQGKGAGKGEEFSSPISLKALIGVCALLWVGAIVLIYIRFSGVSVDYHLGNLAQTFAYERRIDRESLEALSSMGPDILPRLRRDLENPESDSLLCTCIIIVAKEIPGPDATEFLRSAARHKRFSQVRVNALKNLVDRLPEEEAENMVKEALDKAENNQTRFNLLSFVVPSFKSDERVWDMLSGYFSDSQPLLREVAYSTLARRFQFEAKPDDFRGAPLEVWKTFQSEVRAWRSSGGQADKRPAFPEFERPEPPDDEKKEEKKDEKSGENKDGGPEKPGGE